MKTLYGEAAENARMTEWLRRSGLNAIETRLAINHQRHAQSLVSAAFALTALLRRLFAAPARPSHAA